jgi:hypothetical protein
MADQRNSIPDPRSSWREWMSQRENQLNSLFNELMSTEGYGRAMGLVTKILVSMQKSTNEALEHYFTMLRLPTRSDVIDLAERLSNIESRLLAIETNLRQLGGSPEKNGAVDPLMKPPRTKKPAAGKGGAS